MQPVSSPERISLETYMEQLKDQLQHVTAWEERQQLIDEFVAIKQVLNRLDKEHQEEQEET